MLRQGFLTYRHEMGGVCSASGLQGLANGLAGAAAQAVAGQCQLWHSEWTQYHQWLINLNVGKYGPIPQDTGGPAAAVQCALLREGGVGCDEGAARDDPVVNGLIAALATGGLGALANTLREAGAAALTTAAESGTGDAVASAVGSGLVEDVGAGALRGLGDNTIDQALTCVNSFTADTPVTLADGRQEAISAVKVGTKVLATDPQTGQTAAEPVAALIHHSGLHAMVLITLSNGDELKATAGHLIWDATARTFTKASQLHRGDRLESTSGQALAIRSLTGYRADLTAYNLEIAGIHTYYAGASPVLVHNSCEADLEGLAHAIARHTWGGDEVTATASVFDSGVNLTELASQTAGQIGRVGENGNIEYVLQGSGPVGVTGRSPAFAAGTPTNIYTVVRDSRSGDLVTMFPGLP